jgi:hypothetical protein
MDFSKVKNTAFEGIDYNDSPDFVDAFCVYAEIKGEPLTEDQLNELNDSDEKYDLLINFMN